MAQMHTICEHCQLSHPRKATKKIHENREIAEEKYFPNYVPIVQNTQK